MFFDLRMHMDIQAHKKALTCTHTYTHVHIHTCIYTQTYTCIHTHMVLLKKGGGLEAGIVSQRQRQVDLCDLARAT